MFKSEEQVTTFVNLLEKFVKAVVTNHESTHVEDAVYLNRQREVLESFVELACGINYKTDTQPQEYLCPDCNSEMMLRTNRQNGNKFWGCRKYPECKGTRDENGLSRAEREEQKFKKEQAVQQGGFSFNRDKRDTVAEVSPPVENMSWKNPFAK